MQLNRGQDVLHRAIRPSRKPATGATRNRLGYRSQFIDYSEPGLLLGLPAVAVEFPLRTCQKRYTLIPAALPSAKLRP